MKSKFITDLLGITNLESSLITLASNHGDGKTTLLTVIAADFYHDGRNVLFLTDDVEEKTIMVKVRKALHDRTPNLNLVSLNVKTYKNLEEDLTNQLKAKKYDLVIIDGLVLDFDYLRSLSFENDTIFMVTQHQNRFLDFDAISLKPSQPLIKSDMVVSLTRKDQFTFWEKVKYFFCFWLKKPNRSLKILKNRYGRDGVSIDLNIDFEKIKITT